MNKFKVGDIVAYRNETTLQLIVVKADDGGCILRFFGCFSEEEFYVKHGLLSMIRSSKFTPKNKFRDISYL